MLWYKHALIIQLIKLQMNQWHKPLNIWKLLSYQSRCKSSRRSGRLQNQVQSVVFLFGVAVERSSDLMWWDHLDVVLSACVYTWILHTISSVSCDFSLSVSPVLSNIITGLLPSALYSVCSAVQFLSLYLTLSLPLHHTMSPLSCLRKSVAVSSFSRQISLNTIGEQCFTLFFTHKEHHSGTVCSSLLCISLYNACVFWLWPCAYF